jgi:hypothetical protein
MPAPAPRHTEAIGHVPPEVDYVVNRSDVLVQVNDAWSAFAMANGAPHLVAEHVIGRSIWDFIGDDSVRELYRSLMRRVRNGGRSQFHFRCDSPGWRRYMLMTLAAAPTWSGHDGRAGRSPRDNGIDAGAHEARSLPGSALQPVAGPAPRTPGVTHDPTPRRLPHDHVRFASVTLRVEPCVPQAVQVVESGADPVRICGWCMRAYAENRWIDLDVAVSDMGLLAHPCAPGLMHGICPSCFDHVMQSVASG